MNPPRTKSFQLLFFSLILIWCIGIISEYLAAEIPFLFPFLPFMKYNYSIVCHTEPEKLIRFSTYSTMTCARCTGIYFGSLVMSLLSVLGFKNEISIKLLFISSIPIFIDIILYSLNIYQYSHIAALFTGLFLGSIGFLYIQNTIIDFLTKSKDKN